MDEGEAIGFRVFSLRYQGWNGFLMSKYVEKLFVVAMLFYTTGALLPIITSRLSRYSGLSTSGVEFVIQGAFYAVALCYIAIQWRSVVKGAWNAKWILALVMIAIASTAWSQDPLITLRRAAVLCATTAFGIYFATRFDVPDQLRLLAWTCGLVVCSSFLCAILLPQYAIDHRIHYGDWQGAFYQKNMLARFMTLATLVFLFVRFRSANFLRWIGVAGSLTLLVLSRSVTGILVLAVILFSWPIYKLFRTKMTFAIPVFAGIFTALAAGAAYAYQASPALLELLNRDEGLSGRINLWDTVWLSISRRPWLGYGFDAFWQGMRGESANVLLAVGWAPAYAHNGFLDLVLGLGFLGLSVFAFGYLLLWRRAFAFLTRDPGPAAIWLCVFLAFMFFYNLTEGPVVSQNNITWVLYVAVAVSLVRYLPAKRAVETAAS
jgi:exopolysaccharide production protein ExoQ